jgi:hypothetical protein
MLSGLRDGFRDMGFRLVESYKVSIRIVGFFFILTATVLRGFGLHSAGQHTTDKPPSVRLIGFPVRGRMGR